MLRFWPVFKNKVICVSWNGASYNCNPRTIAEALVDDNKWEVYYAFLEPQKYKDVVKQGINVVEIGSLDYFIILFTSRFIISNTRFTGCFWPYKKKCQKYIFTNHGGFGIKKVEFDAECGLSEQYLDNAEEDSKRMDLTLSNSKYQTQNISTAYHYYGEILEAGLPRNDGFVNVKYDSNSNDKYLLYAPTFRSNAKDDVYLFRDYNEIETVVNSLEHKFGGRWYIRIASHPNMRNVYKQIYNFSHPRMIDVGDNDDFHGLLLDSDVLVTDYSSASMDFMLLKRPIFQFIADLKQYDRGLYLSPRSLPFPYSENLSDFLSCISCFDIMQYHDDLNRFCNGFLGIVETGHATEAVINWMNESNKH